MQKTQRARRTSTKRSEQTDLVLTGNEAVAYGAKLARVPLTFFFPIGPSDEVAETMARFYTSGELHGKVVSCENEESSAAAMIGASQFGCRTLFATNSEGMAKALFCFRSAGKIREPLVVAVANRNLEPPGGVLPDWSDTMIYRDMGWIMLWCENGQELLDAVPQAYKIGEEVSLPTFINYEGWEISHSSYRCFVPSQEDVDAFLPPRGLTAGAEALGPKHEWRTEFATRKARVFYSPEWLPEHRYLMFQAMERVRGLLPKVDEEYGQRFGRRWGGIFSPHQIEGAELVFVTMGSMVGTTRIAVEALREAGHPVGLLKLRLFSPFPHPELAEALKGAKAVVTLDRFEGAPLYNSLCRTFYSREPRPALFGRIVGVGGVHPTVEDLMDIGERCLRAVRGEIMEPELGWLLKGTTQQKGLFPNPV